MDPTALLLDTLEGDLPQDVRTQMDDQQMKAEALRYLREVLNQEDADTLLASSITPSEETSVTAKTMIEQIAELDSQQRQLDDGIRDETYENLDLVLDANQTYKRCWDLFSNELNESCAYMIEDNAGIEEDEGGQGNEDATWKRLLQQHAKVRAAKEDAGSRPDQHSSSPSSSSHSSSSPSSSSSTLLSNMDSIMDILELPTLANACVKSGHYGECVEIASHVKRLAIRYSEVPLIQQVEREIQNEIKGMISGLVRLLHTDLKQGHIIKVITYLRRIGPFSSSSQMNDEALEKIFLKARTQFILGELDALEPLQRTPEKYLKRCVEVIREHCFQTIMTFESIFGAGSDNKTETGNGSSTANLNTRKVELLIYSFIKTLILRLCQIFRQFLPQLDDPARYGLFLQLIYCSQSLGRIGGDFTPIVLRELRDLVDQESWCTILRKQRDLVKSISKGGSRSGSRVSSTATAT